MNHFFYFSTILILLNSCQSSEDDFIENTGPQTEDKTISSETPNILLIIADDLGLDATPGYDIGQVKPTMPTLESLINSGIRFNNVWSNPTCTPTRGTILTGKYGFKTQVTTVDDVMPTSETSIQSYLNSNGASNYSSAVIGKWHLSKNANHPNLMGIDYYAGSISGGVQSYWNWNLTVNGQTNTSTEYTTTKFTDLAIDWIQEQSNPWFMWLAYNAPHTPFHLPSNELHSQGNLPTDEASIDANPLPYYMAMLEAMDSEMDRLLSSLTEEELNNTIIIFIGDNGTPNEVVQEFSQRRAKGSVYRGGVNVPMIISGKNVTRINESENALINTTDLFATIANLAGITINQINDSKDFSPLLTDTNSENTRDYIFAQAGKSTSSSDDAIRNQTHKYILFEDGSEALFDLSVDPMENIDLLSGYQLPLSETAEKMKIELETKFSEIKNY